MEVLAASLWGIGTALSIIICAITISRSKYRSKTREPEVQPVSWSLVLQHFVSLICFLFGLFLAWWSGVPVLQPFLPYVVALTAICLAAQLTLMLLQARRAARTAINTRLSAHHDIGEEKLSPQDH